MSHDCTTTFRPGKQSKTLSLKKYGKENKEAECTPLKSPNFIAEIFVIVNKRRIDMGRYFQIYSSFYNRALHFQNSSPCILLPLKSFSSTYLSTQHKTYSDLANLTFLGNTIAFYLILYCDTYYIVSYHSFSFWFHFIFCF